MRNLKQCQWLVSGQSRVVRGSALLGLLATLVVTRAVAQQTNSYSLNWWTIAGGGGTASGGGYSLRCTLGQPLAGTMSGTNYTLIAGFWAVAIQAPAAPLLQITNSAGSAMFFWDKSYGDFVLEQTTVLWPPNHIVWSPVAQAFQTNSTSIYVTVPATGSGQFFRLRKQ